MATTMNGTTTVRRHSTSHVSAARPKRRRRRRQISNLENFRRTAARQFADFQENAADYVKGGRAKLEHESRALKHFLQAQPFSSVFLGTSILMAAGVGLLIGRAWLRREHRDLAHSVLRSME